MKNETLNTHTTAGGDVVTAVRRIHTDGKTDYAVLLNGKTRTDVGHTTGRKHPILHATEAELNQEFINVITAKNDTDQ